MLFYFSKDSLSCFPLLVTRRHLLTPEAGKDPLGLMDLVTKIIETFSNGGFQWIGADRAHFILFILFPQALKHRIYSEKDGGSQAKC